MEFLEEEAVETSREDCSSESTDSESEEVPKQSSSTHEIRKLLKEVRELGESIALIKGLAKKVKKTIARVQKLEDLAPTRTGRTDKRKTDVPTEVRRETRRVYNLLVEDVQSDFEGWKIEPGVTFKDDRNQATLSVLIREVQSLNATFLTTHIKDAAYRFYRSRVEDQSAKRRGKDRENAKSKRRYERLFRKLHQRKKALEKGKFKDETEKRVWKKVLSIDWMSSEESDVDGEEEVLIRRPLQFESPKVTLLKEKLDTIIKQDATPLGIRQRKARKQGLRSSRPRPREVFPDWMYSPSNDDRSQRISSSSAEEN